MTVTVRGPLRVPRALRSHDLGDLGFHQFVHNRKADTDAQREQPFPGGADELPERLLNLRRQRQLRRLLS
jgi:hypothetical protein